MPYIKIRVFVKIHQLSKENAGGLVKFTSPAGLQLKAHEATRNTTHEKKTTHVRVDTPRGFTSPLYGLMFFLYISLLIR